MTKTKRHVFLAVTVIVLCLSLIAAGTYALFSDSVGFKHHLEAGKMELTLERTTLTQTVLGENGKLTVNEVQTTGTVDFSNSNPNQGNIFGIDKDGALVVPCSKYEATMVITNDSDKSDVAFAYYLEIVFDEKTDKDFAGQLRVTVTPDGEESITRYVNTDDSFIGSEKDPIKVLELGTNNSHTFVVSVEFVDDETTKDQNGDKAFINNNVMSKTAKFDLVVHAVQVTGL